MSPSDHYRTLAMTLRARARNERNAHLKVEWETLAQSYLRLAEQADKNGRSDLSDEPILRARSGDLGGEPA